MKIMRYLILFLFSILLLTACQTSEQKETASTGAKRYKLEGKVVSVDKANKKAEIDHKPVEDYMDAMTMSFPIRADWVWDELKPGAEIKAELVVDESAKEPYWLENIGIIAAPNPDQPPLPVNEKFAQIGKDAPDFTLTNQDGKKISLADFKGKPLAITFIYAQCPLPEYCIKMSKNFSDLANQINADENLKDKIRLLPSRSIPPATRPKNSSNTASAISAKIRKRPISKSGRSPSAQTRKSKRSPTLSVCATKPTRMTKRSSIIRSEQSSSRPTAKSRKFFPATNGQMRNC